MSGKPLTELALKALKPREKTYSLSDGNGLIIEVRPSGSRYWIIRYWIQGKERRKSLGTYPDVSLKEARERNRVFRQQVPAKETPSQDTFGFLAEEWFAHHSPRLDPGYASKVRTRLDKYVLPKISNTPMNELSSALVLSVCRDVELTGAYEIAHRVRQIVGMVCRYAIVTGRADNDPTTALKGALQPTKNEHYATITDREGIRTLIRSIEVYGGVLVRLALKFSALTFCRPGEIRRAEWSEIEGDLWKIPAEKMKMRRAHLVPLSRQALAVLAELRPLTGRGRFLFPSARNDGRTMSENTIRVALRSMGYTNDDMTAHGFRAMASTVLNENGWSSDIIEKQLAHVEGNSVRAAYNHAEYLPQRREMMQWWGDWLEGIKKAPA